MAEGVCRGGMNRVAFAVALAYRRTVGFRGLSRITCFVIAALVAAPYPAVAEHMLVGRDLAAGAALYAQHCAACHGTELEGQPDWRSPGPDGILPAPPHDASGDPIVGVPGHGNLGVLQAGALEESNVDLTGELVSMIVAQRAYQANAQTIKTQDQVLQTLVNMR